MIRFRLIRPAGGGHDGRQTVDQRQLFYLFNLEDRNSGLPSSAPDQGGGDTTISLRQRMQRAQVPTISQAASPDKMPRRHFGQV
jgi:hypothetical protein